MSCEFCSDKLTPFFTSTSWDMFLSDDQTCLGRIALVLNRHAESISALTTEEWKDLHAAMKKFEDASKKAFGATMLNWTCLMNAAYKEKPATPHVHWHGRPRYEHEVKFAGEVFVDKAFGRHYENNVARKVSPEVAKAIERELLKYLR